MTYFHESIITRRKRPVSWLKVYNICLIAILSTYTSTIILRNTISIGLNEQEGRRSIMNRKLFENVPSRAFDVWNRKDVQFCVHPLQSKENEGIYYIKIPKTASSTLAHITERIARRESKRLRLFGKDGFNRCRTYLPMVHQKAIDLDIKNRNKLQSFTFSMIRKPSDRLISHFAMNVLQGNWDTSETSFFNAIDDKKWNPPDFQLKYLVVDELKSTDPNEEDYASAIQTLLDEYNFIGVFERFHESLVVLSMIADIPITDVLYYLAPSRCGVLDRPSWVTHNIEDYLENEFIDEDKGDVLLYEAVDKSLDLTIEKLGMENVKQQLDIFNKLISIGTKHAETKFLNGCGIPGLKPHKARDSPYSDMDELPWFKDLNTHDRHFVKEISSKYRSL